ncbi:MAG: DUF2007 domain-containing protein [Lautropia sp.]
MKRVVRAPNVFIAQLWVDQLRSAGIEATMQRYFAGSIAGDIPVDQTAPEVWVTDDADLARAQALLDAIRHAPHRRWVCDACAELVEGPFEACWNCGATMPPRFRG